MEDKCKYCGGDDITGLIAQRMAFRPDVSFLRIKHLEEAIRNIAPWLSASLNNNSCQEYIDDCNRIFDLDNDH